MLHLMEVDDKIKETVRRERRIRKGLIKEEEEEEEEEKEEKRGEKEKEEDNNIIRYSLLCNIESINIQETLISLGYKRDEYSEGLSPEGTIHDSSSSFFWMSASIPIKGDNNKQSLPAKAFVESLLLRDEALFLEEDIAEIADAVQGHGDIDKTLRRIQRYSGVSPRCPQLSPVDWANLQAAATKEVAELRGLSPSAAAEYIAAAAAAEEEGKISLPIIDTTSTSSKETPEQQLQQLQQLKLQQELQQQKLLLQKEEEEETEKETMRLRQKIRNVELQHELQLQAQLRKQTQQQEQQLHALEQQLQQMYDKIEAARDELHAVQAATAAATAAKVEAETIGIAAKKINKQRRAAALNVLLPMGTASDLWAKRATEDPAARKMRLYVQPFLFVAAAVLLSVLFFEAHKAAKAAPARRTRRPSYKESGVDTGATAAAGSSSSSNGKEAVSVEHVAAAAAAAAADMNDFGRSARGFGRSSRHY
ncbi:hypothetical protein, conserved [Eimeria maxima]|uniref:Uncharacterized protein n=1 Tax=Eimeria maxima TaxID=5804 RepID=U6MED2_EIMMA|nr:hypothetical protein, conserved [Eimeria maxima]CDJ60015.1 hypothetical protein, conserved [Eimeria maxima]